MKAVILYILKDPRYKAIKSLIESDNFKSLKEVFEIIPISVVRVDMKVNYNTLRRRVSSPGLLTIDEIIKLADLIEVDPVLISKLAIADFKINTLKKRKQ